jgi:hypothetical protein
LRSIRQKIPFLFRTPNVHKRIHKVSLLAMPEALYIIHNMLFVAHLPRFSK